MTLTPLLPILIIPGFMSSGLEIKRSELKESWEGERIWINLKSLGFERLNKYNKARSRHGSNRNESDIDDEEHRLHNEYTNMWLQHMALSLEDQSTEHPLVTIRPMQGLQAVDYLSPGALTNHVSYVFGPVIRALFKAGYREGVDLDAAPYDWRLAPAVLEERDSYFTQTMRKVEELYVRNGNIPVVLVCHSLGCKAGHYLLNFANRKQTGWTTKYIHTYMPVGAPHLGAPKAIRAIVTGDKMGLDAFVSDQEGLALARSFGSTPWMVPRDLPPGVPAPCYIHRTGVFEITIQQLVDVAPFLKDRRSSHMPHKLKLALKFGKIVVSTDFFPMNDEISVLLKGKFVFSTEPEGPKDRRRLVVAICEPGVSLNRKKKKHNRERCTLCDKVPMWLKLLFCWHIVRYSIQWTLQLYWNILYFFLWKFWITSADVISKASGGSSVLAAAKPIQLKQYMVAAQNEDGADIDVDLLDESPGCNCCRKRKSSQLSIRVRWIPPGKRVRKDTRASIAKLQDKSSLQTLGAIQSSKNKKRAIDGISGYVLLKNEDLNTTLQTIERIYNSDPNEPRRYSNDSPPPVSRIKAIYGINLPTEVGAVYRRRSAVVETDVTSYCTIDTTAHLMSKEDNGYEIEDGIVLETKTALQPSGRRCSGDGTVPYYSLEHVKSWSDSCSVSVDELDGADHREILADKRFHKILVDYVTNRLRADESV